MAGDHNHVDEEGQCVHSGRYEVYIQSHLEKLRVKCDHLTVCINDLLEKQSSLKVLKGAPLDLKKTCDLVRKESSGNYSVVNDKCTEEERDDIREDLEDQMTEYLITNQGIRNPWRKVKKCLENNYGTEERTTNVDDICALARENTKICRDTRGTTHNTVEVFFNDQIQHLKCHCEELKQSQEGHSHGIPTSAVIGAGLGGFLLLLLLVVCCFCYRRRKKNKKKRAANVIYLPAPNADPSGIYQEVYDDRFPRGNGPTPPRLPNRYTPNPQKGRPPGHEEEPAYLEPIQVGSMYRPGMTYQHQVSNPGYELPPQYTERPEGVSSVKSRAAELTEADIEGHYFEPLPTPPPLPSMTRPPLPLPPSYPSQQPLPTPPPTPKRVSGGSLKSVPPTPQAAPTAQAKNPYETIPDQESSITPSYPSQQPLPKPPPTPQRVSGGSLKSVPPTPQAAPTAQAKNPYEIIPDQETSITLGPVPAKRTRKDDPNTESQYYLLEKEEGKGDGEKQET